MINVLLIYYNILICYIVRVKFINHSPAKYLFSLKKMSYMIKLLNCLTVGKYRQAKKKLKKKKT